MLFKEILPFLAFRLTGHGLLRLIKINKTTLSLLDDKNNDYSHSYRFLKLAALLYLEHEITTVDILHNEVQSILRETVKCYLCVSLIAT